MRPQCLEWMMLGMKRIVLSVLLVSNIAYSGTLVANWTPPIKREDGTTLPLSEIKSYSVRYKSESTSGIRYPKPPLTTLEIILPNGKYKVDMRAYDVYKLKSKWSEPLIIEAK